MKKLVYILSALSLIFAASSCQKETPANENQGAQGYITQYITLNASMPDDTKANIYEQNSKLVFDWSVDGSFPGTMTVWTDIDYCGQLTKNAVSSTGKTASFSGSVNIPVGSTKIIFCYGIWMQSYVFTRLDETKADPSYLASQLQLYLELPYSGAVTYEGEMTTPFAVVKMNLSQILTDTLQDVYVTEEGATGAIDAGAILQKNTPGGVRQEPYQCFWIQWSKSTYSSNLSACLVLLNSCTAQKKYIICSALDQSWPPMPCNKIAEFTTPAGGLQANTFYTLDGNGTAITPTMVPQ